MDGDSGDHFGTGDGDGWGVIDGYLDNFGQHRPTSPETRRALHAAIGQRPAEFLGQRGWPPVRVIRSGQTAPVPAPAELTLEDSATLRVDDSLPEDLPLGYHQLRAIEGEGQTRVIVCPEACPLDPHMRIWGWAAQLYAARSTQSWGIGDLADLRHLARWSKNLGAGMLMINPLTAVAPVAGQEASPYYPTSRRFRNPLYLRVEEVPGARAAHPDLESLAAAGRKLNEQRRIDRDAVFQLKMAALDKIWAHRRESGNATFDSYCRAQGNALHEYAVFCTLAEQFGGKWPKWPSEYHRHDSDAVRRFAQDREERVRFHQWLQWLLDEQLAHAAGEIPIVQDLPIGFDPGGADAWVWQDMVAEDISVGAPPDQFNTIGQDWCTSPLIPHRLIGAGYQPFIETIRAALRHAGGLLIDHVMGLCRLLWIPPGATPADGAYVRYPFEHLLAILALEAHRAGAWVVGEDLGTVPPEVREQLARHRVLSYRLLWFEDGHPADYPRQAMAAMSTHDLPTVAGLWTRADLEARRHMGVPTDEAGWDAIRARLAHVTDLSDDDNTELVIKRAYESFAQAPSAVVAASLNDALAVEERPNMPGTIREWPNWSIALPKPIESLDSAALPQSIAATLSGR